MVTAAQVDPYPVYELSAGGRYRCVWGAEKLTISQAVGWRNHGIAFCLPQS